ncbi:hypothetical protein Ahia01_000902300 [Argonauta hians]
MHGLSADITIYLSLSQTCSPALYLSLPLTLSYLPVSRYHASLPLSLLYILLPFLLALSKTSSLCLSLSLSLSLSYLPVSHYLSHQSSSISLIYYPFLLALSKTSSLYLCHITLSPSLTHPMKFILCVLVTLFSFTVIFKRVVLSSNPTTTYLPQKHKY